MVSIEIVGRPKQRMLGPGGEMAEISADLQCEWSGTFQDGGHRNVNLLSTIRVANVTFKVWDRPKTVKLRRMRDGVPCQPAGPLGTLQESLHYIHIQK